MLVRRVTALQHSDGLLVLVPHCSWEAHVRCVQRGGALSSSCDLGFSGGLLFSQSVAQSSINRPC